MAGLVVGALLLSGGAAVAAGTSTGGSRYRTAVVGQRPVDQVLHTVGTFGPVNQAALAFPVGGTVSSVAVSTGDSVSVGEPMAFLDTTGLEAALRTQRATLAQAQLRLDDALSGQSTTGAGTATSATAGDGGAQRTPPSPGAATAPAASVTPGPAATSGASDLSAAQQAVVAAQERVDVDLDAAEQAVQAAASACATTTSTRGTTTTTASHPPAGTTTCQAALQAALSAQQALATDQATLAHASNALDALLSRLSQRATAPPTSSAPSPTSSGQGSASSRGSAPSASPGSGAPSSADLIADQKAVDAATAAVAVAQQAIDQATIVSPIAGTVVSVGFASGEAVGADSTTARILIQGTGGYEANTNVSVDSLSEVAVGQAASVVPDGTDTPIAGKVVSIAVTGTIGSTGTTYPVVIALTGDTSGLADGSTAEVSIVTRATTTALAVPTSALTTLGTRHTVTVLDGGRATVTPVEVGAVGETWTEVTGGLTAGQEVVLADLGAPLPGSVTSSSNSGTTGGTRTTPGAPGLPGGPTGRFRAGG